MHRAPVYAVAAHPEKQSLIFQCGEDICVLNLEESPTGPKTMISVKAQLRSAARHITIEAPYIYVSTAGDSLIVFYESEHGFEYCFGDSVARQCLHHLNIQCKDRLLMTADMGGSLTGLLAAALSPENRSCSVDYVRSQLPTINHSSSRSEAPALAEGGR